MNWIQVLRRIAWLSLGSAAVLAALVVGGNDISMREMLVADPLRFLLAMVLMIGGFFAVCVGLSRNV